MYKIFLLCIKYFYHVRFEGGRKGAGPTLHQRMEICKSQAHLQMLTTVIDNVAWTLSISVEFSLNMFVSCCIYNIHTISNKNKKSESFMIRQHKYMALLVLGRNIQCIIQKIYLNNIYSKPYLYNIDKFTLIDRYFTQFLVRVHMIHFFLLLLFLMHASLTVGVM